MRARELAALVRVRPPMLGRVERVLARSHDVDDLRREARRRLPRPVFDYVEGGADEELTLEDNRAAFRAWRFQPRALRDVSGVDTSCELFGSRQGIPIGLAPTGYTRMVHPEGELAVVRAAGARGVPYTLSTVATTSIEDVAAARGGEVWFQLYVLRDRGLTASLVDRAAGVGYSALEVSVDVAVSGHRARDVRNGFTIPPRLTLRSVASIAARPGYWSGQLRAPALAFANIGDAEGAATIAGISALFDPAVGWDDLVAIRDRWPGTLVLKGPIAPEDAERAVGIGFDAIHLSNHGGRQLDRAPMPLDLLPAVRDRVGPAVAILVDSGIRHGADVAVALARGADFCAVGRPYLYGLAASGERGVLRAIDLLSEQLRRTMQLLGVASVAELRQEGARLVSPAGHPRSS